MNYQVFIEIPEGSSIKYEWDEKLNRLVIDRIMGTAMRFPVSYGYILGTKGGDGDPLDAIVLMSQIPEPGAVIQCRLLGALDMEDEKGEDPIIIFAPIESVDPSFAAYHQISDIPEARRRQISHFFEHYKDLDEGKWVKVKGFVGVGEAEQFITKAKV